jgi:hypothetical protein
MIEIIAQVGWEQIVTWVIAGVGTLGVIGLLVLGILTFLGF